ncbi:unnamed protein product [Meganyctiphanes norvegica]|uniref:Uncharacterized protein n=1 Tax=Meganyctiphanes norvegica TaxID=48144 RepID=A0AAV2SR78_MEGNR
MIIYYTHCISSKYYYKTAIIHPRKFETKKYKPSCCTITFMVLASFGCVMNIAMLSGGYQAMFDAIMKKQMQLKPGSSTYDAWSMTPYPLLMYLYFYNITNPEEYQQGGKIRVEEVGPIVYQEFHKKQNITWNDNNRTVSYMQERWWTYDDEKSVVKEDALITALNTIPISAAYSNRWSWMMLEGLNNNMKNLSEEFFMTVPAGDLLFNGFYTPLLNYTQGIIAGLEDLPDEIEVPDWLQNYLDHNNLTMPTVDDIMGELFPPGLVDYDKFGWFYGRNHSTTFDGHWNAYTGTDGLERLGDVGSWNYKNTTDFFPAPCNKMTGSAGDLFAPGMDKTYIQFFTPDLCISAKLYFKEEYTDENGFNLYRYVADNRTFSNGSTWPENECLCVHGTCAPEGLLNAESCRYGSPSFISFPHFYLADPWAKSNVEGIREPDEENDLFYMDMIPEMGVPPHVNVRMQINMHVQPYAGEEYCYRENIVGVPSLHKGPCTENKEEDVNLRKNEQNLTLGKIDMLANLTDGLVPLIWFEERADLPDELVPSMKMLVIMITTPTVTIILSVSLVISILILAGCSYRIYSGKKKAKAY